MPQIARRRAGFNHNGLIRKQGFEIYFRGVGIKVWNILGGSPA